MSASRTKFYLDKQNSKWLGVCSGIADYTGIDVTWVRVGTALLTFATSGWEEHANNPTRHGSVQAASIAPA